MYNNPLPHKNLKWQPPKQQNPDISRCGNLRGRGWASLLFASHGGPASLQSRQEKDASFFVTLTKSYVARKHRSEDFFNPLFDFFSPLSTEKDQPPSEYFS